MPTQRECARVSGSNRESLCRCEVSASDQASHLRNRYCSNVRCSCSARPKRLGVLRVSDNGQLTCVSGTPANIDMQYTGRYTCNRRYTDRYICKLGFNEVEQYRECDFCFVFFCVFPVFAAREPKGNSSKMCTFPSMRSRWMAIATLFLTTISTCIAHLSSFRPVARFLIRTSPNSID